MDALFFCKPEELGDEVHLQQRLSAADGNSAVVSPVSLVAADMAEEILCRPFLAALHTPGLRIVAVLTSHVTALQEYDEAYSRAIYKAKAFQGMYHSGLLAHIIVLIHYIVAWQVLEITSICCSLVRSMNLTA